MPQHAPGDEGEQQNETEEESTGLTHQADGRAGVRVHRAAADDRHHPPADEQQGEPGHEPLEPRHPQHRDSVPKIEQRRKNQVKNRDMEPETFGERIAGWVAERRRAKDPGRQLPKGQEDRKKRKSSEQAINDGS